MDHILLGRIFVQEIFFLINFENNRAVQSALHKNLTVKSLHYNITRTDHISSYKNNEFRVVYGSLPYKNYLYISTLIVCVCVCVFHTRHSNLKS